MAPAPLRLALVTGVAAGLVNLLTAPFHGAAYFATEDGSTDLFPHQVAWGAWLRGAVPAAFAGGPDAAYLLWGKGTALAVLLYAVAFFFLQRAQASRVTRGPRLVGRLASAGWFLFAAFSSFLFYGALVEAVFLAMVFTILVTLVLTATYGVMIARRRVLPARVGWSLLAAALAVVPLVVIGGHIPLGFWGFAFAWFGLAATVSPEGRARAEEAAART